MLTATQRNAVQCTTLTMQATGKKPQGIPVMDYTMLRWAYQLPGRDCSIHRFPLQISRKTQCIESITYGITAFKNKLPASQWSDFCPKTVYNELKWQDCD